MWNTRATTRKRAGRADNPPTERAIRQLEHYNAVLGDRVAKRLQREGPRGEQPAERRTVGPQARGQVAELPLPPEGEALPDEPTGTPRLSPFRQSSVAPKDHSADLLRYEINLRSRSSLWQDPVITLAPFWAVYQEERDQQLQSQLQSAIDQYCSSPLHACGKRGFSIDGVILTGSLRTATCVSLESSVEFQIPSLRCQHCATTFEVPAVAVMCMGSAPLKPGTLFHISLLQIFHALHWRAGVSASAMVSSLEDVISSNRFLGGLEQDSRQLDDRAFLQAYDAYCCTIR